jgi:hypothetical protein
MKKRMKANCECCEFFDNDEEFGEICTLNLDMDEMVNFMTGDTGDCPYFRFYDEYKFVQKHN